MLPRRGQAARKTGKQKGRRVAARYRGRTLDFGLVKPSEAPARLESKQGRKVRVWTGLVLLVFLLVIAMPFSHRYRPAPSELTGVWRTTEPTYADRFLEIRSVFVVFGTGGNRGELYFFTHVEKVPGEENTEYILWYEGDDGVEYRVSLIYRPGDPPTLHLKNKQGVIWTKEVE